MGIHRIDLPGIILGEQTLHDERTP